MDRETTEWSYIDEAINIVTYVVNKAITQLHYYQNLDAMTEIYWSLKSHTKQLVPNNVQQVPMDAEDFIHDVLTSKWDVTKIFQYCIKALDIEDCDQHSKFYYYEVIFSQPTLQYPIPQVTVSVFFTFEQKQTLSANEHALPLITWRLEGHFVDHDVRFTKLTAVQLIMMMVMKRKFFRRLEEMKVF